MATALTRTVRFRAEHRYWRPEWSEQQNRTAFGRASEAPGHGHEYLCAVTVSGPVAPETGMIMDLAVLDAILQEEVVGPFQNRHLNLEVPTFAYGRQIPTCEAVAGYLFSRIGPRLPQGVRLTAVRVQEDSSLHADCFGLD
jgi:6-pyruvoyltetrahydropterin/6-carboxytetrahydropterin synthase